MIEVVYDEKLLVQFFQDNLSDTVMTWYIKLNNSEILGQKDFIRSSLKYMKMSDRESFQEYTKRWHEVATHMNPLLLEKQMICLFTNTFKKPYIEFLIRNTTNTLQT